MGKVNCLRGWTFCCPVLGSRQCTCQHLTLPAGLASLHCSITKQVLIWSKLNQFSTALPAPFSYLGMLFIYGSRHPTDVFKWFLRAYLDVSRRDNYIFLNLLKGTVSQDSWLFLLQKSKPNLKILKPVYQGPRWVWIMKKMELENLLTHSL